MSKIRVRTAPLVYYRYDRCSICFQKSSSTALIVLKNKFQRYNSKVASGVAKFARKIRTRKKKTDFDEIDPSSILAFLNEQLDVCDSIGIEDEVATWLVCYSMKQSASSAVEALLLQKKICATELHNERLSSNGKFVNYL